MIQRRPTDDRYLGWKIGAFFVAAVLGLGGMYLDDRWLTGAAIVLLATVTVLARLLPARGIHFGGGEGGGDASEGEGLLGDDPGEAEPDM